MVDSYQFESAVDLATQIQAGERSPTAVIESHWERIDDLDEDLNCFITQCREESLKRAAEITARLDEGEEVGPLAGVPVAIKDRFGFKEGVRHTFGSKPFQHNIADSTAIFVERLEEAGAIVMGKTNLPEFAYGAKTENLITDPTPTPMDLSKTAGGSSGGSAAAVSAGLVSVAQGSDVGGSIRLPAAFCGVYGFVPSFGRVPYAYRPNGFIGMKPFNAIGPITRTVEDAGLMLDVMAGPHPRDPVCQRHADQEFVKATRDSIESYDIAYCPDLGLFELRPDVRSVLDNAVTGFEAAGANVDELSLTIEQSIDELAAFHLTAMNVQFAALRQTLSSETGIDILEHKDEVAPHIIEAIEAGAQVSAQEYKNIDVRRTAFFDRIQDLFTRYDLLVTAVASVPPFGMEENPPDSVNGKEINPFLGWLLTWPFNMTGHPTASVPAGRINDLPIGMQLVGPSGEDSTVLAASAAFERAHSWDHMY